MQGLELTCGELCQRAVVGAFLMGGERHLWLLFAFAFGSGIATAVDQPLRQAAVFLTSRAFSRSLAEDCRHAGANALIGKPISAKVLTATISKVLSKPREFIPVVVTSPAPTEAGGSRGIEIELRRGAITMKVSWPRSATADLAAWTRELLR